jgi:hypothetical protein
MSFLPERGTARPSHLCAISEYRLHDTLASFDLSEHDCDQPIEPPQRPCLASNVRLTLRPTWVEAKAYPSLRSHPDLASSLLLLKPKDWYHTYSIYPVSTLPANCDLIIDAASQKGYMNVRRCIPGSERVEVYVIRGRTSGNVDARKVVTLVVDAARKLVGGTVTASSQEFGKSATGKTEGFWDGLGICTWESLGNHSECGTSYL